jgi:hypothetical protein
VDRVLSGGQHQHDGAGKLLLYLPGGLQAVHSWHPHIHQHQLRLETTAELYGLLAVGRFSDGFQVRLLVERTRERVPNEGVVVSHDDP